MLQKEKEQEAEEQERYEEQQVSQQEQREIASRRQTTYEKQVEAQMKPKVKAPSAFMEKVKVFTEILGDPKQAVMMAANWKPQRTLEEELDLFTKKAKVRSYYEGLGEKKGLDDYPLIKDVISDVNKRIKVLTGDKYTADDFIAFSMRGEPLPTIDKNSAEIANLLQLSSYLGGLKIEAYMGDLSPETLNGVLKIATSMDKIEKLGVHKIIEEKAIDVAKDATELSGSISKDKVPAGTPVQQMPDGKEYVQIEDKWYSLIKKK